jgi:hypothetical protein
MGHHKWVANKDIPVDTSHLVNAADMILSANGITNGIGHHRRTLDQGVLECFDLPPLDLATLMQGTLDIIQQVDINFQSYPVQKIVPRQNHVDQLRQKVKGHSLINFPLKEGFKMNQVSFGDPFITKRERNFWNCKMENIICFPN